MMKLTLAPSGCTRTVILTKHYAIKLPKFGTWRSFVAGILSNMSEASTYRYNRAHHDILCPIVFSAAGGLLVVMKRAEALHFTKWYQCTAEVLELTNQVNALGLCTDMNVENFAMLNGKPVCIDYAR